MSLEEELEGEVLYIPWEDDGVVGIYLDDDGDICLEFPEDDMARCFTAGEWFSMVEHVAEQRAKRVS